jgi:hypothetical protein
MKLSYSLDDVERWRDKTYRRTAKHAVTSPRQALAFVNSVGFCLASRANGLELPNLWEAIAGARQNGDDGSGRKYYLSYAWDLHNILPNHQSVYYGKIFRRRPTIVSREYFPYFYALSQRAGTKQEYSAEYAQGRLSLRAKQIMDILTRRSPMSTKELRMVLAGRGRKNVNGIERALDELQRKMFICRLVGDGQRFGAEWAPLTKFFRKEIRQAGKITVDEARYKLLAKYFSTQLVSSVESIHKVFGWTKKDIYHTLGRLIRDGVVATCTEFDGKKGAWYCFIH